MRPALPVLLAALAHACVPSATVGHGAVPAVLLEPGPPPAWFPLSAPDQVGSRLAAMSLEEKVGQVMMVGFTGTEVTPRVEALFRTIRPGGVCLFAHNVVSAAQVARLDDELQALAAGGVPLFIAVDQEGGTVVRVDDGNLVLPGAMLLGAADDPALAFEAGLEQGRDLWRLGINMNFAPVLDVNSNPNNPVIGVRAFGDDPALVARLGAEFIRGQQAASIVTVAKHFPGHGGVDADSHHALPVLDDRRAIEAALDPFRAAARAGLDGMMTAHVAVPALSGDDTPATLSAPVLGGLLRDQLSFRGLVLTDELEMGAIQRRYGVAAAAVMAINAGADMILVPWRTEEKARLHQALVDAARSGEIPAHRLDGAVRNVLAAKLARGVFAPLPPRDQRLAELGAHRELARRIARAGVTLVRDGAAFPLGPSDRVVVVSPVPALASQLAGRLPAVQLVEVSATAPLTGLAGEITRAAAMATAVVVGVSAPAHLELVDAAVASGRPVAVVVMGTPYLATAVNPAAAVLVVYSARAPAVEAAAAALAGVEGTPGRLPVALPGWPKGFGLDPVGAGPAASQVILAR